MFIIREIFYSHPVYIYVYYVSCLWINAQHVWNDTKLGRKKCSKNPVLMPRFFHKKFQIGLFYSYYIKLVSITSYLWCSCRVKSKYCQIFQWLWLNRVFNLKVNRILIWVIYLLRFTIYYITQLTCIYSKCCKWFTFISMQFSTRFTMFLATFLSVL
jgi:hypothetical protein